MIFNSNISKRESDVNLSDATATSSDILSGKTAYIASGKATGSMINRGAVTSSLSAGGSYTIPAGYHNGSGKVTANSLSSQTSGTATAADIVSGKTAWVNGNKLTGTSTLKAETYNSTGKKVTITYSKSNGTFKFVFPALLTGGCVVFDVYARHDTDSNYTYSNSVLWFLNNSFRLIITYCGVSALPGNETFYTENGNTIIEITNEDFSDYVQSTIDSETFLWFGFYQINN